MWNNFDEMQLSAYNATIEDSMKQTKKKVRRITAYKELVEREEIKPIDK